MSHQPKRQPLRLIDSEQPTADAAYRDRISQSHRQYRSSNADVSNPQGWTPIVVAAERPLDVDKACLRATKMVVVNSHVPRWREWLRRLRGVR